MRDVGNPLPSCTYDIGPALTAAALADWPFPAPGASFLNQLQPASPTASNPIPHTDARKIPIKTNLPCCASDSRATALFGQHPERTAEKCGGCLTRGYARGSRNRAGPWAGGGRLKKRPCPPTLHFSTDLPPFPLSTHLTSSN